MLDARRREHRIPDSNQFLVRPRAPVTGNTGQVASLLPRHRDVRQDRIGIVIRRPMKYLYPEGALLQVVFVSRKVCSTTYRSRCGYRLLAANLPSLTIFSSCERTSCFSLSVLGCQAPVTDAVDAKVSSRGPKIRPSQCSTALIRLATSPDNLRVSNDLRYETNRPRVLDA